MRFGLAFDFGRLHHVQQRGRPRVDIALRLNVLSALAVCAAFAFVGAIVLGAFAPDPPGFELASPATPAPGEAVVHKNLPNAFASTDLASRLAALKKPNVVLVGFMTHMCVEATARASIDLGFKATVIASATATRALPDPLSGAALSADEVQRNALAAIADRFAIVAKDVDQLPD